MGGRAEKWREFREMGAGDYVRVGGKKTKKQKANGENEKREKRTARARE